VSSLQITMVCLGFLLASYVGSYLGRVFASSRLLKRMRDLEQAHADLDSSFESLLASHKVLRSRAGMRELRAREAEPVSKRETKDQARARIFGNKSGPDFARVQMSDEA
jgi:hypothetical protein